jgi:hypothetical protein
MDVHKNKKNNVEEEDAKKNKVAGSEEDGVTKIGTDKDGNPVTPNDVADGSAKGNVAKTFEIAAPIKK